MKPIYLYNGKILKKENNKIANDESCCCCPEDKEAVEWRIWEESREWGYPSPYPNGPVIKNVFQGLPCCWTPPFYDYDGYVKLQVRCYGSNPANNEDWKTLDSWTTLEGEPTKCFPSSYPDPCCPKRKLKTKC